MARSHLIYRQVLEVTFPTKKEAMDGQNQVSQLYRHELMPLINEIFDGMLDTDDHIRIDRLELDLGTLSDHNFEEDFTQRLRKQLEDAVWNQIQHTHFRRHRNGYSTRSAGEATDSKETVVNSQAASDMELFTFFIKTGQLPWWDSRDQNSLEQLATTLINSQPKRLLALLKKLLASETYRRRLIYQFSDHVLMRLVQLTQKNIGRRLLDLHEDFRRLHRKQQVVALSNSNFRLLLWETAFDFWLSRATVSSTLRHIDPMKGQPLKLIRPKAARLTTKAPFSSSSPKNHMQAYLLYTVRVLSDQGVVNNKLADSPQASLQHVIPLLLQRVAALGIQHRPLGTMLASIEGRSPSKLNMLLSPGDVEKSKKTADSDQADDKVEEDRLLQFEETIEINNAGLVIIAPFLPRFFDVLGLVSETAFVTDEAAERAALFLQYVATGETEMPEYELALNKILCSLPVDQPLPRSLHLSDHEKEEAENLLESVVEHWKALKGTSVEGLRQTFLIKDGMLSREINGWKLRVERTTVDVLLDRLPWGISVIKLPWNEKMLHVEW